MKTTNTPRFSVSACRRFGVSMAVALAALVTADAVAQSRQVPAPPQRRPMIIHSATVHTVSGDPIPDGYIVLDRGTITEVGSGPLPNISNAQLVNADGLHVYPGLVSSGSQLGLTETGAVAVTRDATEYGDFKPEVRAAVAVNPDTDLIPVTRSNGILTTLVMPTGGIVSGHASTLRLDGWTWEDMAIDTNAGLVINWPRAEPRFSRWSRTSPEQQRKRAQEQLQKIDDFFDEAVDYLHARDNNPDQKRDSRMEALRPALAGEERVYINADTAAQIESAVAWCERRGMKCTIVGGSRADEAIPILKKHDVPVILEGTHRLPRRRHDDYDQPFTLPNKLHEAGVKFCIASGEETAHERNLNHNAATAAAYGLPRDVALRSITLDAAEILGLGNQLGSIDAGKQATLIVTTGDPLEITTDTLAAFIDGRQIDLGNRQKSLYAKYREKYRQLGLLTYEPEG